MQFACHSTRLGFPSHSVVHLVPPPFTPPPPPPISFACLLFLFLLLPPIGSHCAHLSLSFTLQSIPAPSFLKEFPPARASSSIPKCQTRSDILCQKHSVLNDPSLPRHNALPQNRGNSSWGKKKQRWTFNFCSVVALFFFFFKCHCCDPFNIGDCLFIVVVVVVLQSRDAQDCRVLHRRGPRGQVLHLVKLRRQPGLRRLCVWTGMGGAGSRFVFVLFFLIPEEKKIWNLEPKFLACPISGGPGYTLWVHGRPPEEWQHRPDGPLLRYLHCGSHLPRLHPHAVRFGRLSDQKGNWYWGVNGVGEFLCAFTGTLRTANLIPLYCKFTKHPLHLHTLSFEIPQGFDTVWCYYDAVSSLKKKNSHFSLGHCMRRLFYAPPVGEF